MVMRKPKYVPMKPEVVARLSPEDKKEYEQSLQKVPKRYGLIEANLINFVTGFLRNECIF